MSHRFFPTHLLPSIIVVCLFLPGTGQAQVAVGIGVGSGRGLYPYPPSSWNYPFLPPGGPYTTTVYPFVGWPGYRGAFGSFWTNGLSLYGPPVPVYGPIPGVFGNSDLVHQWNQRPTLGGGIGYYGWIGPYRASPRPTPLSVGVYAADDPRAYRKHERYPHWGPSVEPLPGAGPHPGCANGGCMTLSVKVPQPAAEVFVDGVKTNQNGTDRIYTSPPLEAGKQYQYEVTARWIERGVTVERKTVVTGKPGEVVRVDLAGPDVIVTGR